MKPCYTYQASLVSCEVYEQDGFFKPYYWIVWVGNQKADPIQQGWSWHRKEAIRQAEHHRRLMQAASVDLMKTFLPDADWQNWRSIIARMTKDGEDGFVMENDDAVATLHRIIDAARGD